MSIYQKKLLDLNKKLNLCRLLMASFMSPEVSAEHHLGRSQGGLSRRERLDALIRFLCPFRPIPTKGDWEVFPLAWIQAYAAQALNRERRIRRRSRWRRCLSPTPMAKSTISMRPSTNTSKN